VVFQPLKGENMKKIIGIVVLVFCLSLTLSACGGGNSKSIDVTLTEFAFTPMTITVPAGATVKINVINNGAIEHEFAIMKLGTTVIPPFGEKDEGNILWELSGIQPGTSGTGSFTAPTEPGTYEIVCGIAGHIENGMVGSLIVQ